MGFRFRKSFTIIPGLKMNITHRGVGLSAGGRRARVSINSRGRTTTTFGIPGTGLSYTHTGRVGGKRRKKSNGNRSRQRRSRPTPTPVQNQIDMSNVSVGSVNWGIFFKNVLGTVFILVGIILLLFSFWKGVISIVIGVVLWNLYTGRIRGEEPLVPQEGLEQEIQNTIISMRTDEVENTAVVLHGGSDREHYEFMKRTL